MVEVVEDLRQLPLGSHAISLHVGHAEAADHAAEFVAGTPGGQSSSYWIADATLARYYDEKIAHEAPNQVGCVHVLPSEQVEYVGGRLRPVAEVRGALAAHPEGMTAAGETLSYYWQPETIPAHLEYEAWFDALPRTGSRFLCPYDLRTVPPSMAPEVMRELGSHHSHVALSRSAHPAARLLELLLFSSASEVPPVLHGTLTWAKDSGLLHARDPLAPMSLSAAGEELVAEWESRASPYW